MEGYCRQCNKKLSPFGKTGTMRDRFCSDRCQERYNWPRKRLPKRGSQEEEEVEAIDKREAEIIRKEREYLKKEELYRRHPHLKPERRLRKSKEYTDFREGVLERDDNICVLCGSKATYVHHKVPVCVAPELACKIDNGVALCGYCHRKQHPELPDALFD